METSWLALIINGNGGPIPSFLSGRSKDRGSNDIGAGSHLQRMFSSDFPQGNAEQPGYVLPSNHISVQAVFDPKSGPQSVPESIL